MLTVLMHTNNLVHNFKTKYIDIILRTLKMFLIFEIPDICCYTVYVVIYWMFLYSEHLKKTVLYLRLDLFLILNEWYGADLSEIEMFRRRTEHHNPWLFT